MQKSNFSFTPAWKARSAADSSADDSADQTNDEWTSGTYADDTTSFGTLDVYVALAFKELQSRLAELWDELLESLLPIFEKQKEQAQRRSATTLNYGAVLLLLSPCNEIVRCRSPPLLWES